MLTTIITGTRPNLVKAAPLIRELEKQGLPYHFIHTGQHYDDNMFMNILDDLDMPTPDFTFNVRILSTLDRIWEIILRFQRYCEQNKPDSILVFGDVDSSLAVALAANKLGIPLGHIEAGERSFNRSMPEEINRILIDELADYHFCSSIVAHVRLDLKHRKYPAYFVGNLMIDQLKYFLSQQEDCVVKQEPYGILTLHRQENVDDPEKLKRIMEVIGRISEEVRIYFPIHPRTRKNFATEVKKYPGIIPDLPWLYSEFIRILKDAAFIITDSGGIQVEASYMNIPTITLRNETEWTDTIAYGSNMVIGNIDYDDVDKYLTEAVGKILSKKWKQSSFRNHPEYKTNAAENIVNTIRGLKL